MELRRKEREDPSLVHFEVRGKVRDQLVGRAEPHVEVTMDEIHPIVPGVSSLNCCSLHSVKKKTKSSSCANWEALEALGGNT